MIPTGYRSVCVKADQGTEFTHTVFCRYDICVKLAFAVADTRQQIGANEQSDRTRACTVRCWLAVSGLPKFLWRELMQTAVYHSNRAPHAALNSETPYTAL